MPAAISVVMITRNRRESALRAVAELRAVPERPPVIVVDNASTDGTALALRDVPGVAVVEAGSNFGAAGRNHGAAAATSPLVAFSDDDSWWAAGALARAVELFESHPRLGLLAARTLVGPELADDPINEALAAAPLGTEPDLPGPTVLGFLACAAVVRRDAFLAAGGFHPRYGVGAEEQLLALDLAAAGWGLCYVPEVIAHHHPSPAADRTGRTRRVTRNDLWTAWLRRPLPVAARATLRRAREAARRPEQRAALGDAVLGLPWVVRQRRPVPAHVEAWRRRLD